MKNSGMNATKLRAVLGVFVVALIALAGVGFYFVQDYLSDQSVEVNNIIFTSNAGKDDGSQPVTELQKAINERQSAIAKANAITAPYDSYTEQVISSVNKIAGKSGITIANYSFDDAATKTTKTAPVQNSVNGVQIKTAKITIANPVQYTSLLKFLKLLETNLPKLQISGITVAGSPGSNGAVKVEPLTVEVYTR